LAHVPAAQADTQRGQLQCKRFRGGINRELAFTLHVGLPPARFAREQTRKAQ